MTVYRIERNNRFSEDHSYGPYQSGRYGDTYQLDRMYDEHSNPCTHPTSWTDGIIGGHVIACPSFKLLHQWFSGYLGHLALNGYKCYAIKLPRRAVVLGKSGKQCGYIANAVLSRKRISFVTGLPI